MPGSRQSKEWKADLPPRSPADLPIRARNPYLGRLMSSHTNHIADQPGAALVTGAANRLGAAIAWTLAEAGYAVAIHHRGGEGEATALAAEIKAAGGTAVTFKADLANRRQRAALIGKAARLVGPLTVLVNNASSFAPDSAVDLDEELWDSHFAIHVEAPAFLARDFAAQLPESVQGNILNIVDERVLHLSPNYFSYTLTKAALWAMTQTLAQSLAPRIRVNAIGPGPTLKERGQSDAAFQRSQGSAILGYGATPRDVSDAVLYLLNARSVSGQMIALDGGKHLDFPAARAPTPRRPAK
jgi:NAD(P)-dependent dehydrogenase (short-subunit alcohol dehydrogenase family)